MLVGTCKTRHQANAASRCPACHATLPVALLTCEKHVGVVIGFVSYQTRFRSTSAGGGSSMIDLMPGVVGGAPYHVVVLQDLLASQEYSQKGAYFRTFALQPFGR